MSFRNIALERLEDPEIIKLLQELEKVTHVRTGGFSEMSVFDYISQCIYPNGGSKKPVKLVGSDIARVDDFNSFSHLKKVGLTENSVYRLLSSLLPASDNIENHSGSKVYTVLNLAIIPSKKKPPRYF